MVDKSRQEEREKLKLEILDMLNQKKMNNSVNNVYNKSINAKKKKINGKTYVSKKDTIVIKNLLKKAALIASAAVTINAVIKFDQLNSYQVSLNNLAKEELSYDEYQDYKNDHEKYDVGVYFEHYANIKDAKETLKENGNYDFWGNDKDNPEKSQLTKAEADGVFNLSPLQKDAIELAAQEEIEEYKKGGRR